MSPLPDAASVRRIIPKTVKAATKPKILIQSFHTDEIKQDENEFLHIPMMM